MTVTAEAVHPDPHSSRSRLALQPALVLPQLVVLVQGGAALAQFGLQRDLGPALLGQSPLILTWRP